MLSQQETHRTQMIHSPIFLPKFAMAFHIRKLLDESDPDSRCQTNFCDPEKNLNGSCPINCMKICPDCCRIPIYYYAPTPPMLENVIGQTPSTLSKFLTVFLSILATSFLFFACYIIYKIFFTRYNRRRPSRSSSADNDEPGPEEFLDVDRGPVFDHPTWYIRTVGLDPSVIGSIAIVKYEKGRGLIEGTECSVCLTEFQENERLRLLPKCNHAFHVPCIDTWLRAHTNCPMCRARIASDTTPTSSSENGIVPNLSGVDETNQTGASGAEDDDSGLRVGIEEEFDEYQASVGLKMNEVVENGIQPARRSVSMDSLPASAIRKAIANASSAQSDETSGRESVKIKETDGGTIAKSAESSRNVSRLVGSPSSLRPSRTGSSSSIKRSVSCSARILIPRYSGKSSNPIVHPRML